MATETKTKSYALSKTKVRDMITEKFGTEGDVSIAAVLALFEGSTGGSTGSSIVYNEDKTEVIGKKCSYFGVFMPISEFGKRGDTYGYQSKLAESINRKLRSEAVAAKKLNDEKLDGEEITVDEWRAANETIKANQETKVTIEDAIAGLAEDADAPRYFETAEELTASM